MSTFFGIAFVYAYILGMVAAVFIDTDKRDRDFGTWFISAIAWWFVLPACLWSIRNKRVYDAPESIPYVSEPLSARE